MDTATSAAAEPADKDHITRKGSELLDIIKAMGASDELAQAIGHIERGLEWVVKHFEK